VPSPKLVPLVLSEAERVSLGALACKSAAPKSPAMRAWIVLACAEMNGVTPLTRVAELTGVSRETVRKWRERFMEGRQSALADTPRPGAPRRITNEQKEALAAMLRTEERGPGQGPRCSTRAVAAETGMSQSSVSRIWRDFRPEPHLVTTRKPQLEEEAGTQEASRTTSQRLLFIERAAGEESLPPEVRAFAREARQTLKDLPAAVRGRGRIQPAYDELRRRIREAGGMRRRCSRCSRWFRARRRNAKYCESCLKYRQERAARRSRMKRA